MPRLWYPERFHVQVIAHKLAGLFFSTYDSPLPAFALFGGEREGGALLESALALPRQSFSGHYLYRMWHEKAGVLLRSLIKNHPLVDGNKRIAVATTFVFLLMNGRFLLAPNKEMVRFALEVAASEPDMSWRKVAKWVRDWSVNTANIDELVGRAKEQNPELISDIDEIADLVVRFKEWAARYRRAEAEALRECRRMGIDAREFYAALAEHVSQP